MNTITIAVEVNLGEATLNALQRLLQAPAERTAAAPQPETKPAPAPETKAAPAPAAPAAPAKEDPNNWPPKDFNDDIPGDITDEELRAAVKAAKEASSAAEIRAIFQDFGIKTSIECPNEKRRELLKALVDLTLKK